MSSMTRTAPKVIGAPPEMPDEDAQLLNNLCQSVSELERALVDACTGQLSALAVQVDALEAEVSISINYTYNI
jgi:hypothetical protein